MFTPKYVKQGKMLEKGVKKFLRYKADLIPGDTMADLDGLHREFCASLKARDKEAIEKGARKLTRACERAVPPPMNPGLRENLEVILVAVVIAVGIRAYFLQPFKIPTGSMRPTLNGIIATPLDEAQFEEERPGLIGTAWEYVFAGRNYVNKVAPEDGHVSNIRESSVLKFFTFTRMDFTSAAGTTERISIYAPMVQVLGELGLARELRISQVRDGSFAIGPNVQHAVKKGQVLARGYIDTGDQVLVNKFAYHFRSPRRGEVFVFNTRGITGIEATIKDKRAGSQHYIKRLAGLPGDDLEVREPELWINGERAQEEGFVRVMGEYRKTSPHERGYTGNVDPLPLNATPGQKEYWAMGDNSAYSFDSRGWGAVPEENIVGPALVVYWPFAHHWGFIR